MVKIETIVSRQTSERIFEYLEREIAPQYPNSALVEKVDALKKEAFTATEESAAQSRLLVARSPLTGNDVPLVGSW